MEIKDPSPTGNSGGSHSGDGQGWADHLSPSGEETTAAKVGIKGHLGPIVATILVLVLYVPTVIWLIRSWLHSSYYSHGFLVPLVFLVIAWTKRESLRRVGPSPGAFMVLAVGMGLYVAGFAWGVRSLSAVSLVVVLAGLVWVFYGIKCLRAMAFPVGFLFFMIPFPYYSDVGFRLQEVSIHSCTWLLHVLGLPVTTAGNEITVGDNVFSIGLPCSGLNTLVALVALAAVFVYLLDGPAYKRVILFLLSFLLAVIANAFRIVSIVLIGHYYDVGFATGFYHDVSSPLFFLLACLCLISVSWIAGCRLKIGRQKT